MFLKALFYSVAKAELLQTVDNFDFKSELHPASTMHTKSALTKDEHAVLEELVNISHVFDYIPGHQHHTFKSIAQNLALSVNKEKLCTTINKYNQELKHKANVAKFCNHEF